MRFFDKGGDPITVEQWCERSRDFEYCRVAIDNIGGATISTVWFGVAISTVWFGVAFGDGPPLIFETKVFGGELDDKTERYSTLEDALLGHGMMCARVGAAAEKVSDATCNMQHATLDCSSTPDGPAPNTEDSMASKKKAEPEELSPEEAAAQRKNVTVVHEGDQIILPVGMTPVEARLWLKRKEEEEERVVRVWEEIQAFALDAAYALSKAMRDIYGFTSLVPTPGFFGASPPTMVGLEVGVGQSVQVPWGRMQVPNIDGWFQTSLTVTDGKPMFVLNGEVKQKDLPKVKAIAEKTREYLRRESVYRGKAIRFEFQDFEEEEADFSKCPSFIDTSKIVESDLVFSSAVQEQITTSLFTPIERTDLCRHHKVPLKRGILLEGPYGVGKTLAAYVTAAKAVANGWTFLYLENVEQLEQAILFAQQYQPAVVFAEDIDQVIGDQERDEETNGILNTIDGVINKDSEVLVVLTTNHVEDINQAMLRPGRLDAVISVRPPDADTVVRLVRLYARGLVSHSENLSETGELMAGNQPAMIREVVERAKLAAMSRLREGDELLLSAHDLAVASRSLLSHLELLKPLPKDERSAWEKGAQIVADAMLKKESNGVNQQKKPAEPRQIAPITAE